MKGGREKEKRKCIVALDCKNRGTQNHNNKKTQKTPQYFRIF